MQRAIFQNSSAWIISLLIHALFLLFHFDIPKIPIELGHSESPIEIDLSSEVTSLSPTLPPQSSPTDPPTVTPPLPSKAAPLPPSNPSQPLSKPIPDSVKDAPSTTPQVPPASSSNGSENGVSEPAKVVQNGLPVYPKSALNEGLSGAITVEVSLSSAGSVTGVRVIQSSGHSSLDTAFINTIRSRYHFTPKRVLGIPVPSTLQLEHTFELE